jgi:ABC-type uncharacterized transport system permease subunit
MPVLWLRVAVVCYGVGLLYALVGLTRSNELLNRIVLHAAYLGMVFHLVSLTEEMILTGKISLVSVSNTESALAFLIMIVFAGVFLIYRTTAPGVVVFPVVFLLTLLAISDEKPFSLGSETVHRGWLFVHIALILAGYAALVVSFGASLLYLLQEHSLKAKNQRGILTRLPALEIIDQIGFRSLLLGFPFMTLGLIAGTALAKTTFGRVNVFDPKIFLSLLMWTVYLVLLYTRWNAGWRGRRAAYLASGAFLAAVLAWTANTIHRFVS